MLSSFAVVSASTLGKETVSLPWSLIDSGTANDFDYYTAESSPYDNYTLIWDLGTLKWVSGTPEVSLNFLTFAVEVGGQYFNVAFNEDGTKTVTFGAVQNGSQVQADYSYTGNARLLSADFDGNDLMVKIDGTEVFSPDLVYADALKGYQVIAGELGVLTGTSTLTVQFYNPSAVDSAVTSVLISAVIGVAVILAVVKKV